MPENENESAATISNLKPTIDDWAQKIDDAEPQPMRTVGQIIRPYIKSAISDLKKGVDPSVNEIKTIIDSSISQVNEASDTFGRSASDVRDAMTAMVSRQLEKDTLERATQRLTEPILDESISEYETASNAPGIGLETFGWSPNKFPNNWAVSAPTWPRLSRIDVNRVKGIKDPNYPPKDLNGNEVTTKETTAFCSFSDVKVNIRNFIDCLKVEGIAEIDYSGELTNNIDPVTKKKIHQVPLSFEYYPEEDPPRLRVHLPRGGPGDITKYAQHRTFMKLLYKRTPDSGTADRFRWNYPSHAYTPFYIRKSQMTIANSSVSLGDFEWVAITFQKAAFMENPSEAEGTSEQGTHGKIFVTNYNKVIIDNNWDWNSRVTVFLQRGKHATASFIDAQGRKFSRTVQWMCYGCDMPGSNRYTEPDSLLFSSAVGDGHGIITKQWEYCLPYQNATTISVSHSTSSDGYTVHVVEEASPKVTANSSYANDHLAFDTSEIFMLPVEIIGIATNMPHSVLTSIRD